MCLFFGEEKRCLTLIWPHTREREREHVQEGHINTDKNVLKRFVTVIFFLFLFLARVGSQESRQSFLKQFIFDFGSSLVPAERVLDYRLYKDRCVDFPQLGLKVCAVTGRVDDETEARKCLEDVQVAGVH